MKSSLHILATLSLSSALEQLAKEDALAAPAIESEVSAVPAIEGQ